MKIFKKELIKLDYYALDKKSCLQDMVDFLYQDKILSEPDQFLASILEREKLMSTGIGRGIAIPHARSSNVSRLRIIVFVLENELDFDAIDGEPVKILFMIAVPEDMKQEYMKVLSQLSNFCKEADNRDKLLSARNQSEIYELLKRIENEV